MTDVLIRRDWDTDTHTGTAVRGHREEMAAHTPRTEGLRGTNLADILISGLENCKKSISVAEVPSL